MSVTHTGYGRINVFRLDDSVLVSLAYDRFLRYDEAGSHLDRLCAQHKCRRNAASICDTSSCNHRNRNRINHLRNKCHRRRLADVSAGLHAFCNDCICAAHLHQTCLCNRSDNRNYLNASFLPHAHVFAWNTGAGRYDLDAFFHNYLCHVIRIRAHQHDIDTKRLLCQLSRLADLLADNLTWCIGAAN